MYWKKTIASLICFTSSSILNAQVMDGNDLQQAIITANNSVGSTTINFGQSINLATTGPSPLTAPNLRPLNAFTDFSPLMGNTINIFGGGFTLNGNNTFRGFLIRGGTVNLNGINFYQLASFGGDGGNSGGGGGAGIGGALIIDTGAIVTATNCTFQSSTAQGGAGGQGSYNPGAGGGGGLGGSGGPGSSPNYGGGGGGGLDFDGGSGSSDGSFVGGGGSGVGQLGGTGTGGVGGTGGNNWANAGGGIPPSGTATAGGAGGAGGNLDGSSQGGAASNGGGGGGGGANGLSSFPGGAGGDYGGGGGAGNEGNIGGAGGFCGGGGGGGVVTSTTPPLPAATGGTGGFGGGGGGGGGTSNYPTFPTPGQGGPGGFGGGAGGIGEVYLSPNEFFNPAENGGGGGGAGFGGAIFIRSGGTLIINGCANFMGNTVSGGPGGSIPVNSCPEQITPATAGGNGSAAGADIFMMTGAQLIFDITCDVNVPTPIGGGGPGVPVTPALTKLGCAQLTLNGVNTYVGGTIVQGGELTIEGSIIGDITVANGAILSGDFSTTGNIFNSGIISPGAGGNGQITIAGVCTNQPDGIIQIDITPTGSVHGTIIDTAGTTTLNGGTLDIVVNAGNYIGGTQYVVIDGPVNGTFGQVIQTGVNANLIDIQVSYSSVVLTILQNFIFQNHTINPGIPREVADCIIFADITPGSDFATIIEQMGLISSRDVNRALYNMSPVNYGALDWINARNNNYIADILSERLFQLCCSPRDCCNCNASVWIDVFGNLMNNKKRYGHMSRFVADAIGVITGMDYCFNDCLTLGGAFAYTHTWLDWKGHHGHGNIDSYYGALYGSYCWCCLEFDVAVIGGASDHHLKRKIDISGPGVISTVNTNLCSGRDGLVQTTVQMDINRTARSHPWGYFFTGHLGLRTDWDWCCTTFEPFGLIDYNYFHRQSFREHGAKSLDLNVKEHTQNMLRGEAGLRVYRTRVYECYCVAPYIGLSWVGEFPLGHCKQRASFAGMSCVFDVNSYHSSLQLASPQAGIKWTRNSGFSFLVGYKGLYNSRTSINELEGGLEWVF